MFKKKKVKSEINPEDIFPDSLNLPGFAKKGEDGVLEAKLSDLPFFIFSLVLLFGAAFLGFQLYRLQIAHVDEFRRQSNINQFKVIYTEPQRGVIYDVSQKKLVSNIPSFSLVLFKSDFRNPDDLNKTLESLATLLGTSPEELLIEGLGASTVSYGDIPGEFVVYSDAPREVLLEIESRPKDFPGVGVLERSSREYNFGESISHIAGYVGKVSADDVGRGYAFTESIGKAGLEYYYEKQLKGVRGKKIVEVDALGSVLQNRQFIKPEEGGSLLLNIDAELQTFSYEVLRRWIAANGKRGGAIVISDPRDGAVRALVSYPSFDNNIFKGRVSRKQIDGLLKDERSPFLNRAISGAFPPGSTFKPMLAAAALEEKIIDPARQIYDPGFIEIPNPYKPEEKSVFRDWKFFGYVDMKEAIAWSANVYFYTIGGGHENIRGLGIDRIKKYANLFGLGKLLGIDLPGEAKGLIPDPSWKEQNRKSDPYWRVGDTYNVSIGQGDVLATPLQLNFATAALANGGKLMKPRVVKAILNPDKSVAEEFGPDVLEVDFIDEGSLNTVREGMRRTVTAGSAWALAGLPVSAAGKTGTAQTETQVFDQNHAWFTGFAPYEKPELAITVFVEKGGGGASVSVPIAKEILEWYFNRNQQPTTDN